MEYKYFKVGWCDACHRAQVGVIQIKADDGEMPWQECEDCLQSDIVYFNEYDELKDALDFLLKHKENKD